MTLRFSILVRRLAADESASTLAEYALVMAVLTISMMVAFDYVADSGNTAVTTNETNMSHMAAARE